MLKYKTETLPVFEQWATEANGKFLMGTDDLTQLDIHCSGVWEIIYLWNCGAYASVEEVLQSRQNAPNWCAYMERFRNHPAIKPVRMNAKASENQGVRSHAWNPDEKCHLSLEIL